MRRPRENGVLFSLWAVQVCSDPLWLGQRPSHVLMTRRQSLAPSTLLRSFRPPRLCYLDDTAVHSEDAWRHLRVLSKVLAAFCAVGLQISPGKAQLFRDHIKYLGHEVSAQGISILQDYTSVIKEWPIPNTLKTLRSFLGKCGYYRHFIKDYATMSAPNRSNMKGSRACIKMPPLFGPFAS